MSRTGCSPTARTCIGWTWSAGSAARIYHLAELCKPSKPTSGRALSTAQSLEASQWQPASLTRSAAACTRAVARVQRSPGPVSSQMRVLARRMEPSARQLRSHGFSTAPSPFGDACSREGRDGRGAALPGRGATWGLASSALSACGSGAGGAEAAVASRGAWRWRANSRSN